MFLGGCPLEASFVELGNKNIHEFVSEKLRNEHRKGTFYNWNTIELDAITFLQVHIKSIMCGERGYE